MAIFSTPIPCTVKFLQHYILCLAREVKWHGKLAFDSLCVWRWYCQAWGNGLKWISAPWNVCAAHKGSQVWVEIPTGGVLHFEKAVFSSGEETSGVHVGTSLFHLTLGPTPRGLLGSQGRKLLHKAEFKPATSQLPCPHSQAAATTNLPSFHHAHNWFHHS